ncbi:MAG TPA: NAD-dependent succinate-semialdehyde dehydrogenase [Steroidobacteraceae bacterium]|nr:NAD-dependent succinate-semialdehyde dehydrogenase [Steroidobacteraceae bacterium]
MKEVRADRRPTAAEQARLGLKSAELLRQAAYIDGQWTEAARSIEVVNPASQQLLGTVPAMGAQETERAVAAAHRAFDSWRRLSAGERGVILQRWYELIMAHQEDLARLMTAEQGKPLSESRGEIAYSASFIEWFAQESRRAYGQVIPGHAADKRLVVLREPVGVVAAITPWNFPSAMITRKVGPALAAGCTVVLKPSELTPFSALALAWLATKADVPAGVFNIVTGEPAPIGEVFTTDPRIRKFTFTGSTRVGKMLAARCMGTVKHVSLELGGNAPFIVFDDADLARAVDGALASKFRNTGQTCVCANRILVQRGIHDEFVARLSERVAQLVVGDGLDGETHLGPLINADAVDKVERHVQDAVARGGKLRTGGKRIGGNFFQPTVVTEVGREAALFTEETFGPLAGIVRFSTEAQAIELANDTTAGLAAYFYTRDLNRSWRVSEALQYGMIGLNTGLISTTVAPFGGVKESGLGREGSSFGMQEYLETKLVCTAVSAEAGG